MYVDDLLVTGDDKDRIQKFKMEMQKQFEMSDLGIMHYFLGMEIMQKDTGILMSQSKYAKDLLKKWKMKDCKPVSAPMACNEKLSKNDTGEKVNATMFRSIIGGLLFLTHTRPDIMFSVSYLSRFMHEPCEKHLRCAKRILKYVKGTAKYGLWFSSKCSGELMGFSDSDWAGNEDDSKSTSGYVFTLGNGVFSWCSKKQEVVAQSSAEAEYVAAVSAANQAIWIQKILSDLGINVSSPMVINVDNKSAISLVENPVLHGISKHIRVKFHVIREMVANEEIKLNYCPSEAQVADVLTKSLQKAKFEHMRNMLGVHETIPKEENVN
ncbi:uncharacterized mitochondrial protein AtMg00810-like [Ziziphus jujuba]|uniref:Uncharacterized mitochondrial protein AtMg00810-like n=1 Tax=Ziziphus jujuba TaxID=326968 RepID=A0ABM3ZRT5_ZIZJJ|nr:uncharacterized mitochondrial protein AtMg00810-like [Ziziphus jujuba]